jgi:hypothetical protein
MLSPSWVTVQLSTELNIKHYTQILVSNPGLYHPSSIFVQ